MVEIASPACFTVPDPAAAERHGIVFDAAVLANPGYPTSRLLPKPTLLAYLDACTWVVVDERSIELTLGGESMVDVYKRQVVHRARSRATAGIQTARGQKRIEALTRVVGCCDVAQHAAHRASVPSPSPSDAASSADRRSSWRQLTITPTRNSTNPHVTPISATLNTGKSMNTGSMKSTT